MKFEEAVKSRRSVRAYESKDVEEEKLRKILELTNLAPSAGNLQSYKVFVVKNEEKRVELARAAFGQDFLTQAPVVLVFCADPEKSASRYGERGRELYSLQDATIACTFAMLAATALGLGSCWVGAFDEEDVKRVLGIEESGLRPIALLPVGYPGEKPYPTPRRKLEEMVTFVE